MMLWIALAVMTVLAVGLLLPALLRRAADAPTRAEYDLRVYRDQLAEIERDVERGLIDPEQAAAARTEIGRRLIAAGETAAAEAGATPATGKGRVAAAIVAVIVPVVAIGIYARLGDPELALHGPSTQTAGESHDMDALVAQLGERLKSRPNDATGWALYARSLAGLGRFAEAEPAFAKAIALNPKDADLAARYAETLIFRADGSVTPAARKTLESALAVDRAEPRARYYLGLADRQAGRVREALERWIALEAESPADAPWRKPLAERIAEAATEAGIDADRLAAMRREAASRAPARPAAPPSAIAAAPSPAPGPTAADIEASTSMSDEQRNAMVRTMVDRLAERLKEKPDDADGWMRLGRSYGVLDEPVKSRDAYARAAALRPNDAPVLTAYAEAIAAATPRDAPIPPELGPLAERILAIDPTQPGALWYSGLSKAAAGDTAGARERWMRLLARLDPASPEHAALQKRIDALASQPSP